MTSTIKVNNIQNQCGANIINESSNTITIGASGDTIALASGASQTGFGRTGTVNWDTTKKTTAFTAVSGNGYFIDTSSAAITVTLPASPSAGDIVGFNDYARNFATNNLTVARNGSNIQGVATNAIVATNGQSLMFVYVDATKGWMPTEDQTTGNYGELYVTATGGTITTCGNYKIHTFTSPGTFCVSCAGNPAGSDTVDYLVIAGGGGGAHSPNLGRVPGAGPVCANCSSNGGGGGGAGGYRFSNGTASGCYSAGPAPLGASALPVSVTGYPITVGGGGTGSAGPYGPYSGKGSNSVFSTITSTGGGGGGGGPDTAQTKPGGSGGGAGTGTNPNLPIAGGTGNDPSVSPPQGNPGGTTSGACTVSGNGGGGAGAAASNVGPGDAVQGTQGGDGLNSSITGSPVGRGGGGSGGSGRSTGGRPSIGFGGGASGCYSNPGSAGTANTGGGGGGAAHCSGYPGGPYNVTAGAGGSGVVIIRYKFQ